MDPKPSWLKIRYNPANEKMKLILGKYQLNTVCQGAHCPNCQECWSSGTATFMVLGDECTRGCRFCSVKKNARPLPPDPNEPKRLAKAIDELKLKYVVLTSVDRDDLPDFGAGHFAKCIKEIKKIKTANQSIIVEALVPDFNNDKKAIATITGSGVDVLGHNIETVERLSPKVRDARASYRKSLDVLKAFKKINQNIKTKSSIMLGLGETKEEVIQTMKDLLESELDFLTLGQYLQPTKKQLPIIRYVPPEEFKEYETIGKDLGFKAVLAGPFVRSSYKAAELFRLQ